MTILDSNIPPTRRQFLTALASVAPVAGLALAGCTTLGSEQVDLNEPHPMPQVNEWLAKLDAALVPITAFSAAIAAARRQTINIPEMVNLHLEAFVGADRLDNVIERADEVLERIAGQEIHYSDYIPDEYIVPPLPIPYGPPERTAKVEACMAKIDETIITLERLYGFMREALVLPPSAVDGAQWIKLEYEVIDAELKLDEAMQSSTFFEDALEAATGKRSYYWCIKADLINNEKIDAAFVQNEINAFREDYPGQVAELQALLNARMGVRNG